MGQAFQRRCGLKFSEGKIYFYSDSKAWKIKRIQNNSNVEIHPSTFRGVVLGDFFEGKARILESIETKTAIKHLKKKYILFRIMGFFSKIGSRKRVFFEVTPHHI